MSKSYICDTQKFTYSKGYVALPIEIEGLPESIVVDGVELMKRSSFHVSLLYTKDILIGNEDLEQKVIDFFCFFAKENDISFVRYTGEFRFVELDERKTVIALCKISNLKEFSEALGQEFGFDVPPQPTHVTLYTLQSDAGIGLNSPVAMEQNSNSVELSDNVENALNLISKS